MASRRKVITDRVKTTLGGNDKPADLVLVEKSRFRSVQGLGNGKAAQLIYLETETPDEHVSGGADLELVIRVATLVNASSADTSDDALDPFLEWAKDALLDDPVLNAGDGAIASQVSWPHTSWPDDEAGVLDKGVAAALQKFTIVYQDDYPEGA